MQKRHLDAVSLSEGSAMAKRIVVCADGTWNKPEQTEQGKPSATNVAKVAAAVAAEDNAGRTHSLLSPRSR